MSSTMRWLSGMVVLLLAGVSPAARAETSASPLADDPTLIALAVALSCSDAPEAVEAAPGGSAGPASTGPEIELVATVRAKSLRFVEVPKVDVVFRGTGKRRTVWKTERVNLPVHPQPGVTYHDVQVRLTISSDVDELTSMLREAKRASRGIRIEDDQAAAARTAEPPRAAPKPKPSAAPSGAAPAAPAAAAPVAPAPVAKPPSSTSAAAAAPTPTTRAAPPVPMPTAPTTSAATPAPSTAAPPASPAAPTSAGAAPAPAPAAPAAGASSSASSNPAAPIGTPAAATAAPTAAPASTAATAAPAAKPTAAAPPATARPTTPDAPPAH